MSEEKQIKMVKMGLALFGVCEVFELICFFVCYYRKMDYVFFLIGMASACVFLLLVRLLKKYQVSMKQFLVLLISCVCFVMFVWGGSIKAYRYALYTDAGFDYHYLYGSASYINDILDHWDYETADEASRKTYDELCEGVIVTDWKEPQSELQKLIAQSWHVDSFRQYRKNFYTSWGQAKVLVKIEDNRATIRLLNPTPWVLTLPDVSGRYLEARDIEF